MIRLITQALRRQSVREVAQHELDQAQHDLLQAQSALEYAQSMVRYHDSRIGRLRAYLLLDQK